MWQACPTCVLLASISFLMGRENSLETIFAMMLGFQPAAHPFQQLLQGGAWWRAVGHVVVRSLLVTVTVTVVAAAICAAVVCSDATLTLLLIVEALQDSHHLTGLFRFCPGGFELRCGLLPAEC